MTYKYKCSNCKRTTEKQNKKVLVVCGCGYEMALIKSSYGITILKNNLKGGKTKK